MRLQFIHHISSKTLFVVHLFFRWYDYNTVYQNNLVTRDSCQFCIFENTQSCQLPTSRLELCRKPCYNYSAILLCGSKNTVKVLSRNGVIDEVKFWNRTIRNHWSLTAITILFVFLNKHKIKITVVTQKTYNY